jgi:hypothetical protein
MRAFAVKRGFIHPHASTRATAGSDCTQTGYFADIHPATNPHTVDLAKSRLNPLTFANSTFEFCGLLVK